MIFHKAEQGKRRAHGANGRTYTIGYALGARKPWVLEEDVDDKGFVRSYATMQDAESRAHEIEGGRLGDEQNKNLTWRSID